MRTENIKKLLIFLIFVVLIGGETIEIDTRENLNEMNEKQAENELETPLNGNLEEDPSDLQLLNQYAGEQQIKQQLNRQNSQQLESSFQQQIITNEPDDIDNQDQNLQLLDQVYQQPRQQKNPYQSSNQPFNMAQPLPQPQPRPPKPILIPQIKSTQFPNIGMYTEIPLTFQHMQIFRFYGIVLRARVGAQIKEKVNVVLKEVSNRSQIRCVDEANAQGVFEINCRMEIVGQFIVTIFAGRTGVFSRRVRTVVPSLVNYLSIQVDQSLPQPQNVRLEIINNLLFIKWDSYQKQTYLSIQQSRGQPQESTPQRVQYYLTNFHNRFQLPFQDFRNFSYDRISIQLSHIDSQSSLVLKSQPFQLEFEPYDHAFDDLRQEVAQLEIEIPWRVPVGGNIVISGYFDEDIRNQIFVIEPDLSIRKVKIFGGENAGINKFIKAGTRIYVELQFGKQGTNILQLNAASGLAIINRPVYVGDGYPLIPDYRDLGQLAQSQYVIDQDPQDDYLQKIPYFQQYFYRTTAGVGVKQPPIQSTVEQKREYMLVLLNALRKKYKVAPVELDQQLNMIAQFHSDDMAANNYVSHTSLNGDTFDERARKLGFQGALGENLAQAYSLTEAHLGLERSAQHLENSVNNYWVRVGIGITYNQQKQLYVAFSFSTRDLSKNPLNSSQMAQIQQKLINIVLQKYPNMSFRPEISNYIWQWLERKGQKQQKLLEYLISSLRKGGLRTNISLNSVYFTVGYASDWELAAADKNYFQGYGQFFGFGLAIRVKDDRKGILEAYIVFL